MKTNNSTTSNNKPKGVTTRKLDNGKTNPKYVDVLDEDKPIAGQKFACVSFISPEKILKQKEIYFFQQFLQIWEFDKSMKKFIQFLNFISFKYKLSFEDITSDFHDYVEEEKHELRSNSNSFEDDYKTFIDNNEEKLETAFNKTHNFQTSTRGLKIRGVYPSVEEAELRCKMLREIDPNHDVFVGPIGLWMPFHPEAYKTGRVEYLEDELNQLMHDKNKNETFAKTAFDQRLKEAKQNAIYENIKLAEKSGSSLSQSIDEDGNLISINKKSSQETTLSKDKEITVADIRAEMFEGENIVLTTNTDKGIGRLSHL